MVLFIDVDGDLTRIANLHRLDGVEIGRLNPKLVDYNDVIICSKNAYEYIESIAPDKRCFEVIGNRLEIHRPTKIMLNFIAEDKLPDVESWKKGNFVPTIWYDSKIEDFGYLFQDYLADGIILREIPFTGNITQKQFALAKSQLNSFCKCFFAMQSYPNFDLSSIEGDIGFKIRTLGEGPDRIFDNKFFGFGSSYLDLTENIIQRLYRYAERWPERREEMFNEIISDIVSKGEYDITL